MALRNLLGELLKYFTKCEDELNNTLIEEILKHGFEKNLSHLEDVNLSTSFNPDSVNTSLKRVHFTPNFTDFMNIVDNSTMSSLDSKDISIDLKNELSVCLERLKSDANEILALTTNLNIKSDQAELEVKENKSLSLDEKVSSLTRQLISETQAKNEIVSELNEIKNYVKNLEIDRVNLENELGQLLEKEKVLENNLEKAREKISELIECGHKEIVSEGYGENQVLNLRGSKYFTFVTIRYF